MRKILSLSGLIVLAAIIILPNWVGHTAESEVKDIVGQNALSQSMQLKLTEYDRGWFTSTGNIQAMIQILPGAIPTEVNVPFKVWHGPVIFKNKQGDGFGLQVGFASLNGQAMPVATKPEALLTQLFPKGPVANVHMKLGFFGTEINTATLPIDYNSPDLKLQWPGLNTRALLNHSLDKVQFHLDNSSLSLQTPQVLLQMGQFAWKSDATRDENGLWVGDMDVQLAKLSLSDATQRTLFSTNQLNFTGTLTSKDNKASYASKLDARDVLTQNILMNELLLDYEVDNLDSQGLAALNQLTNALAAGQLNSNMPEQQQALFNTVIKVLSQGPNLTVHQFSVKTNDGAFELDGNATLPATSAQTPPNWAQQMQAIKHQSTIQAKVQMDENIARDLVRRVYLGTITQLVSPAANGQNPLQGLLTQQEDNILSGLVSQHILAKHAKGYNVDFTWEKGMGKLNGQDMATIGNVAPAATTAPVAANPSFFNTSTPAAVVPVAPVAK